MTPLDDAPEDLLSLGPPQVKPVLEASGSKKANIRLLTDLLWRCTTPKNAKKRVKTPENTAIRNADNFHRNSHNAKSTSVRTSEQSMKSRVLDLPRAVCVHRSL